MLSGSAWNLTYPHQKHPDGPGCTPCARSLTLSTTSSEVAVHGACCRMSFHLGKPSTTTSEPGAWTVPGSGCTLPCANGYEYVSRGPLNRVRALWIPSR